MGRIDKKLLMKMYAEEHFSLTQIAKMFSVEANTIKYHLVKMGVELRPKGRYKTYQFNENFFSTPNELNSYWAGFIAADFYVRRYGSNRTFNELSCSLKEADKLQLERFMRDIGHTAQVKIRRRIRKDKVLFTATVSIISAKILDDLECHFNICCTKKQKRSNPPINLNTLCKLAFIVGYIDGDGWLQYGRGGLNLGVCGTHEMVLWIKGCLDDQLRQHGVRDKSSKVIDRKNLSSWRANIGSWFLAVLLERIPVPKMERKLPQIYTYLDTHKHKFKNSFWKEYAKNNKNYRSK